MIWGATWGYQQPHCQVMRASVLSPPSAPLRLLCRPSWRLWRTMSSQQPYAISGNAEHCGLLTYLAAIVRMKSRPYWTSTSDIKPWVRLELLLWWAQSRTWQKSHPSWQSSMVRFGTWSEELRATELSQPFFQTPGSQAQLFDSRLAPSLMLSHSPSHPLVFSEVAAIISVLNKCCALTWEYPTFLSFQNIRVHQNVSDLQMCRVTAVSENMRNFAVARKLAV